MSAEDAQDALLELARQLVGELAGGKVMELMLAAQGAGNPDHSDAGRRLAGARWASPPGEAVNGRKVIQVFTHPQSPVLLYDLGGGYFAEGERGKAPGVTLHEPKFTARALLDKGWQVEASVPDSGEPGTGGAESAASDGGSSASSRASDQASGSGRQTRTGERGSLEERVPRRGPVLTPERRAQASADSERALARALGSGAATDEQGTLDGHGQVWHPDRATVHKDIVQAHLDAATGVPSQGKAILTGGITHDHTERLRQAGAWKEGRYHVVSVPDIQRELGEQGLGTEVANVHPEHAGVLGHREAAHVASMVTSALAARQKNMVIHGSMSDPDHVHAQVKRLRAAGYNDIRGMHVGTPVDAAVDRAQSDGHPAHSVLSDALSHGHDRTKRGFEAAQQHMDGWEQWDGAGDKPVRRSRGGAAPGSDDAIPSVEDLVRRGR